MNIRACIAVFISAVLFAGPAVCGAADPRNLIITVFQTDNAAVAREMLVNTPAPGVNESRYHVTTRTYGTDSIRPPGDFQQVQVVEGQGAHFSVGYSSPEVRFLWAEDTGRGVSPNVGLVTRERLSGFYVQAELQGSEVLLKLDRYNGQSRPDYSGYGSHQNIRTTVQGRLGGWLDAGGSLILDQQSSANHSYSLQSRIEGQTRLLVKVELAPRR